MVAYTGKEQAVDLSATKCVEPDTVFDLRPPAVPTGAVPVFDDALHAIIGYRHECGTGIYRLYDLKGNIVGIEEKGLEAPLNDSFSKYGSVMITHPPRLALRPRDTECRSQIVWDRDALILSSTFTYSDEDAKPHNPDLADRIDRDFGIDQDSYRLVLGEMDVLLDSSMRIRSIEIRTNPLM